MKIDLKAPILDLAGNVVGAPPLRLGDVVGVACLSPVEGDDKLSGQKKYDLFALAQKCAGDSVDLSAEEIATLKERVGRVYAPLVVGRVFDLVDPKG